METNTNPNNMNVNMGEHKHAPVQKVLFSIVILAAFIGVFYLGQMYEKQKSNSNPEQVQVTTKNINESKQDDWNTFSNKVMGIEFEYPLAWGDLGFKCTNVSTDGDMINRSQVVSSSCGEVFVTGSNYSSYFSGYNVFLASTPRPLARGGSSVDTYWIKGQSYIDNFCVNIDHSRGPVPSKSTALVSCETYTNKSGIKVARISEGETEGVASSLIPPRVLYYIYTGNQDFPAISFNSKPENQNVMDQVVDSLKLLPKN